jgi:DNA-binding LacI/PurR family transcriptional regulator
MTERQRVTISDLARALNISKASVSYALNGRPGVSEQTRRRVIELAEQLGFHPNSAAVALSAARTRTIGIVIAREPSLISTESFYMRILFGIEQYLNEVDAALLLRLTGEHGEDLEVYRRWSRQGRVDGFILFDEHDDDPRLPLLRELGMPAVVVSSQQRDDQVGRLVTSARETVTLLLDHLADLGHTRVAHISGPLTFVHERMRGELFDECARDRGMDLVHAEGSYSAADGARITGELLAADPPPTGMIFSNDLMAVAAVRAAADVGVAVPAALSVLSWEDSALCELSLPAVTAVDHHSMERGRQAAELLFDLVAGGTDHTRYSRPAVLSLRGSTAPPPADPA